MSKELDNYVKAFEIAPLTTFYKNSILVAIIATILNLLIFSMAAYVLVRCRFRFKGLITMLFSAALVIPGAALLQPLYQTLNSAHLYDTLTGLIVVAGQSTASPRQSPDGRCDRRRKRRAAPIPAAQPGTRDCRFPPGSPPQSQSQTAPPPPRPYSSECTPP